jgi:putative transposase
VSRQITYNVKLTAEEKEKLHRYLNRGKASARSLTRARILLLAAAGRSNDEIKSALNVSKTTISRIRRRYCEGGLEFALSEKPRSGAPPKIDGRIETQLIRLACSELPEGRSRWTLRLLADKLVELECADSISHMSVHRMLKKMKSSHGKRSNDVSER